MPLPKLFVFDLDYTLWPFWCDTHVTPPVHTDDKNQVIDRCQFIAKLYNDVYQILDALHKRGFLIAAASRSHAPDIAQQLLELFGLDKFFTYKEIYPGTKLKHFEKFKQQSQLEYNEMIFYDDEHRNIVEIGKLGVTCQHVSDDGLTLSEFQDGLKKFRHNSKASSCNKE